MTKLFIYRSLVFGCATLSKEECFGANWSQIGFNNAVKGLNLGRQAEYNKACEKHGVDVDVDVDVTTYEHGYGEGLQKFCTADIGYQHGLDSKEYLGICPENLEPNFLQQYIKGLKLTLDSLSIEHDKISSDLDSVREKRSYLKEGENPKKMDNRINSLENRQNSIFKDRERSNQWITQWSSKL